MTDKGKGSRYGSGGEWRGGIQGNIGDKGRDVGTKKVRHGLGGKVRLKKIKHKLWEEKKVSEFRTRTQMLKLGGKLKNKVIK